ncbi:hypothetical protein ACWC9T_40205 [Kitasatospora sp. NPDC001159]
MGAGRAITGSLPGPGLLAALIPALSDAELVAEGVEDGCDVGPLDLRDSAVAPHRSAADRWSSTRP